MRLRLPDVSVQVVERHHLESLHPASHPSDGRGGSGREKAEMHRSQSLPIGKRHHRSLETLRFDPPSPVSRGVAKREPARPRVLPPLRAAWRRICIVSRWIDDSWVGDLVGVICLFIILFMGLFMGGLFQ